MLPFVGGHANADIKSNEYPDKRDNDDSGQSMRRAVESQDEKGVKSDDLL